MKLQKMSLVILLISNCIVAQINDVVMEKTNNIPSKNGAQEVFVQSKNNDIEIENRNAVVTALRSLLADNYVLYTKALNFHWNVEGELFSQLHEFFKTLYESLQETNDMLAERIRALGAYSPASLQEFLSLTQLKENKGQALNYRDMLAILLADFETVIRAVRSATVLSGDNNDWGTNNMLAGLLERLEKHAWMIRAHLQK